MKPVRLLLALGLAVYGLGQGYSGLRILTYSDPAPIPPANAIVVLSGPWTAPDAPIGETRQRVARGVSLWQAGLAPRIVMSGGGARAANGGPGDAEYMAEYAIALGVPPAAITLEAASHSTLQNAWLTRRLPGIDPEAKILLVTHRYHLPRAVPSFRWAGFTDITPIAASRAPTKTAHVMEGIKWPLNILRAAASSVALALGTPQSHVFTWLR